MPRSTHVPQDRTSIKERILKETRITLPEGMMQFLESEVIRLNIGLKKEGKKDKMTVQRLIRALITTYYERRVISSMINPDD